MCNRSKSFALILAAAIAISSLSILATEPTGAQSTAKPSIPRFTLEIVDHSYEVPITYTYSIDPYTGKEVKNAQGGYRVENKTIDVTIRNQPSSNENKIYYNIRVKGHFAQESEWKELYSPYSARNREGTTFAYQMSPSQSSAQYTIISCPADYPVDSKIDFQVQALEGYFTEYYPYIGVGAYGYRFTGGLSDWSDTQTITIPTESDSTHTPNPTSTTTNQTVTPNNPTATPTTDGNPSQMIDTIPITTFAAVVIALVVIIAILTVGLFRRKRK